MPTPVFIYETAESSRLGPPATTRPVWDIRLGPFTGADLLREALPDRELHWWAREELTALCPRPDNAAFDAEEVLLLSGHLLPLGGDLAGALDDLKRGESLTVAGHALARKLSGHEAREFLSSADAAFPSTGAEQLESLFGPVLRFWWEIIELAPRILAERFAEAVMATGAEAPKQFGGEVYLAEGVEIGAGVVFASELGPLLLGRDVKVGAQSFLGGLCYLGEGTRLRPQTRLLHGVMAGPQCRLGGEIEDTVIQGYSNKQHDGFLGHAAVGEWVNLGAGTSNSDLKNNFGSVRVQVGGEDFDTGRRFLGCCLGDHAKVGIQGRLNTGTVLEAFTNWFGTGFPPKHLTPFSWGGDEGIELHRLESALETARRVMPRRGRDLDKALESVYRQLFEDSAIRQSGN